MSLKRISPQIIYVVFFIFQIIVISVYLFNKSNGKLNFNTYLQTVKFSTLFLLFISLIILIQKRVKIFKLSLLKLIFIFQILTLYITMIIHTDIKAINSPTILFMLTSFLIFSDFKSDLNFLNKIVIKLAIVNLIFVLLQILNAIPVAQLNERDSLGLMENRATGILFNAFALGYASAILFLICLYFFIVKQNIKLNILGLVSSFIAILFSETRTPFFLITFLGLLILFQNKTIIYKNWKIISILSVILVILTPIVSIFYGNYRNLESYSTLNGRVFLWECIINKRLEFFPFGVGVQAAFPKGFCSNNPWFANLRHPENMFLLNFVESGLIGLIGIILLFLVTFWMSAKVLREKNALPLAITVVYFMCSIFYVPLFHYLPFLENRPADRGIYNFFLFTLLWLIVLVSFKKDQKQS